MDVVDNITQVRNRITQAAQRADRNPDDIVIVAVSKTMPVEKIKLALQCGIQVIGENRVQEAKRKYRELGEQATWHMVGHLQTNKVKAALKIFSMIQSLDSQHLAREINKRADKPVDCLIEVNTSGEESKYGISPAELIDFYESLKELHNIEIKGLMTIGPGWAIHNPEASRGCFNTLRKLKQQLQTHAKKNFSVLSMGMTSDFEIAIEEGSTMVRIGTAIFGPRKKGQ